MTSETRVDEGIPGLGPPRLASIESMTRYDAERPSRTTSPHEIAAAISTATPRNRVVIFIPIVRCTSPFDDARRNENEQLCALIARRVALEQPFQERNRAKSRSAVVRHPFGARVYAPQDRPLSVAH